MNELQTIQNNNFKFNKKFGQNFIFDKNLLEAIVADSKITKEDEVLEIGPGAGTLTKIIAGHAKKVVSYEIDTNLKPVLEENLKGVSNSAIIFKDALKTTLKEIEDNFNGEYKIVANLPYYITTPLIFKFIGNTKKVKSLTIMVQKEVGDRLTATPKNGDYGSISVILDYFADVIVLRQVPRRMFTPSPNVDSCVVQITLKNKYDCNDKTFQKVVKSAFSNKRKTIVNNLSKDFCQNKDVIKKLLNELNINENVRGDALFTEDFVKISQKLASIWQYCAFLYITNLHCISYNSGINILEEKYGIQKKFNFNLRKWQW